jgi:hypothetical protein
MKFTKAKPKDRNGSSFTGYMMIAYKDLVECLGEPHDTTKEGPWRSGDQKTRVEWAFKSNHKKPIVITVYDYKEELPLNVLLFWHVGSKGGLKNLEQFFKEKGLVGITPYTGGGILGEDN